MPMVDLRVAMPPEELAILDGYAHGTGSDRASVVRQILREWSDRKLHEAIGICRVARVNPLATDTERSAET